MKRNMKRYMATILATGLTLFFAGQALAIGTPDNETISNTASVTFTIGGNTPPAVESEEVTFEVDTLIRPVVASKGNANIVAGVNDFVLPFTVTNESNRAAGNDFFVLSPEQTASNDITMDNVEIYEDTNNSMTYDSGDQLVYSAAASVSVPASITNSYGSNTKWFFIVADAPASDNTESPTDTAEPGNTVTYSLIATAVANVDGDALANTETPLTNANDPNVHEIILFDDAGTATVDAQYDGKHSASGVYTTLATLDISKTASNGTSNYHLPGDTVTYTITVTNTDPGADASSVEIRDVIPTNTTYVQGSLACAASAGGTQGSKDFSNDGGTNWGHGDTTSARAVRCHSGIIAQGNGTGTMTFNVTID